MMKFVKNRMKPTSTLSLPEDVTAVEIGDDVAFICPVILHRVNKSEMKNTQGIQDTIDTINRISRPTFLPDNADQLLECPRSPIGFSPRQYQRNTNLPMREISINNNNHYLDEEKRSTWSCLNDFIPEGPSSSSPVVENIKYLDSPSTEHRYDSLPRAPTCRNLSDVINPPILPPSRPAPKPVADFQCQCGGPLQLDFTEVRSATYEGTSAIDGMTPDDIRRQIEDIEQYIYKSFTTEDVMHIIQKKIDDAVERSEKRVERNVKEVKKDVKDIAKSVASNSNTLNTLRMEFGRKHRGSLGLDKNVTPSLFVPPTPTSQFLPQLTPTPEDPVSKRNHEPLTRQESDTSDAYYRF